MKKFLEVWEDAANSVGGGGVSMPSDAVHDKKKRKFLRMTEGQRQAEDSLKGCWLKRQREKLKTKQSKLCQKY